MITLVETAYDDPVAVELVAALRAEINERYAYAMVDMTEAERAEDDAAVAAQVAPADVRAPNGAFLVAWLDGAPVGCGAVMALDRPGGVAEVKRMYTVPGGRRRGVSQAVLAALETRAAELGYRWLQLETGLAQPEAMSLYERAGWQRITPYGRYQDSPETACYGKDLGSPPAAASTATGTAGRRPARERDRGGAGRRGEGRAVSETAGHAALVGATAAGKSALALALARVDPTWELVSVDSMQVYRGMDIGTAKPSPAERAEVPHHLIDLLDPWDDGTLAWFQAEARVAIAAIEQRGRRALLVGGTGLYLQAIVDDLDIPGQYPAVRAGLDADPDTGALHARLTVLDPTAAARMEPTNRRRVLRALEVTLGSGRPFSSFGPGLDAYPPSRFALVGIGRDVADLDARIEVRYARQVEAGFLDEVRRLLDHPRGLSRTAAQALGYKELAEHLAGRLPLDEALDLAVRRTRRFARRQRAWFRRDPRITWLDVAPGGRPNLDALLRLLPRA